MLLKELKNHERAVTSVDWKLLQDGKSYLVSCSDDNYVRIYNGETFDLIHSINTHFITDWHTLTYLALESGGRHLAMVSENGYLFVWDVLD